MKDFLRNTWKHRAHVVMALPAFLILFFIMYVPMTGVCLAFKDYKTSAGIFGSDWNGLENFKFLIASKRIFLRMTRNTLIYYVIFTAVGTVLNVALAVARGEQFFENSLVFFQNSDVQVAVLARERDCRCRAGSTAADDDNVVHTFLLIKSSCQTASRHCIF